MDGSNVLRECTGDRIFWNNDKSNLTKKVIKSNDIIKEIPLLSTLQESINPVTLTSRY